MIVKEHKLTFGKGQKTTTIMYGSCWHIGNPNYRAGAVQKFIDRAKTMPWWHVGDMIESILPSDPRFSVTEHKDATTHNMSTAIEFVEQAKDTCVGLITGNHEWKASSKVGDVSEFIARHSKAPYLGGVAFVDWVTPNGRCRAFTAHGRGGMGFNSGIPERDDVNRRVKLRRDLGKWRADIKCVGHYHRFITAPAVEIACGQIDKGKFVRDYSTVDAEWCVACPSLFGNYENGCTRTSYAEIALMPPTDLGWDEIVLDRAGKVCCVREIDEDGIVLNEVEPLRLK